MGGGGEVELSELLYTITLMEMDVSRNHLAHQREREKEKRDREQGRCIFLQCSLPGCRLILMSKADQSVRSSETAWCKMEYDYSDK